MDHTKIQQLSMQNIFRLIHIIDIIITYAHSSILMELLPFYYQHSVYPYDKFPHILEVVFSPAWQLYDCH